MSSIRLKTKDDIRDFFRILAEESVKEARSQILDPVASDLEEKSKLDKKAYKSITEEEEGEISITTDAGGDEDLSASAEGEEGVTDVTAVEEPSIEDVSLDQINKKIKIMRSGLSVDDTSVQQPMGAYFELLSDAERKAALAFLNAFASIMTGAATGENAADPSDPPYNVQMSTTGEEEELDIEVDTTSGGVAGDTMGTQEEEEEEESGMPIRVGGVQVKESISEIRRKVLDLLGKS